MKDTHSKSLRSFLDIVDPQWAADALSDDELEIPSALDPLPDNGELALDAAELISGEAAAREDERWADLGLDQLALEGREAS